MSLLAAMKQKKKERLTVKHPLYQRDISMRYAYVMGVALVAATGGGISETGRAELEKLVYAIGLPEDALEKVIATAEAAAAESIDTVVDTVLEKEEQYCLLLEMHLAALRSGAEQQKEQQELIGGFRELMRLSAEEGGFLRNFAQTALEKNTSMATDVLTEGYENQLEPNFEVLKYFLPELDYREAIEGFTLEAGQSRRITRPCIVKGPIVVKEGALLSIQGIEMVLGQDCGIKSEGGQLEIRDSRFRAEEGCLDAMLRAEKMPRLVLKNVAFDGQKRTRAIEAYGGVLEVENCNFANCYAQDGYSGGAIFGKDCNMYLEQSVFRECYSVQNGGAIYVTNAKVELKNTAFEHCFGKSGGGIHLDSCYSSTILNSTFSECEAKEVGGGIQNYSNGSLLSLKDGSICIEGCRFESCSAGHVGGGVHNQSAVNKCVKSCSFFQCTANIGGSGGGVHASRYDIEVEKCTFEGCKPRDKGVS